MRLWKKDNNTTFIWQENNYNNEKEENILQ